MDVYPFVSIIIPSGRPQFLARCIESILRENYPKDKMEIIIVSPHVTGSSQSNIRYIKTKELYTPGYMRNIGAEHAYGDYLLFLDDDCVVEDGWIRNNILILSNNKIGAVSGMISSGTNKYWEHVYDFSDFDLCQVKKPCKRVLSSATFAIKKIIFQEVGGFDRDLRVVEDVDLCLRLQKKGYWTIYDPRVRIIHYHRKDSLIKILKHMYFGGYNAGLILNNRYENFSSTARIMKKINKLYFYPIFIFPLAVSNTISCLKLNFKEHPRIVFYLPFVFLAKLSYHVGVQLHIINKYVKK